MKSFRCLECGKTIRNPKQKHSFNDCLKHKESFLNDFQIVDRSGAFAMEQSGVHEKPQPHNMNESVNK